MHIILPGAESNGGNAVACEPVGIEPAVGDTQLGFPAERACRGLSIAHNRTGLFQSKWIIVAAGAEADLGTPAASVSNSARGIAKCLTIRLSDHAVELAVMATALARYQSIVRHDISRLARARSVRAAEAAD